MPMLPSIAAAATYGAIKLGGYGLFAVAANRALRKQVSPILFALAKTALGFAAGLSFFLFIGPWLLPSLPSGPMGDLSAWALALPLRYLVWILLVCLFFKLRVNSSVALGAALLGTAWSYILDCIMWLLYQVLPGMQMPWC